MLTFAEGDFEYYGITDKVLETLKKYPFLEIVYQEVYNAINPHRQCDLRFSDMCNDWPISRIFQTLVKELGNERVFPNTFYTAEILLDTDDKIRQYCKYALANISKELHSGLVSEHDIPQIVTQLDGWHRVKKISCIEFWKKL